VIVPPTHRASLRLAARDAAAAQAVAAALAPEAADGPEGAAASVAADGAAVVLEVAASDLSTLRAALHGLVRLADVAARAIGGQHKD
jgi:tRNA threonylcarbamoyladenosine modification (KEOPS) complex  Pcc1 subunit